MGITRNGCEHYVVIEHGDDVAECADCHVVWLAYYSAAVQQQFLRDGQVAIGCTFGGFESPLVHACDDCR